MHPVVSDSIPPTTGWQTVTVTFVWVWTSVESFHFDASVHFLRNATTHHGGAHPNNWCMSALFQKPQTSIFALFTEVDTKETERAQSCEKWSHLRRVRLWSRSAPITRHVWHRYLLKCPHGQCGNWILFGQTSRLTLASGICPWLKLTDAEKRQDSWLCWVHPKNVAIWSIVDTQTTDWPRRDDEDVIDRFQPSSPNVRERKVNASEKTIIFLIS